MNAVTVVILNLEDGKRLDLLPELIAHVPDVGILLFQEGKYYNQRGQRRRYEAERLLCDFELRSYLTPSVRGQLHELVFARWDLFQPEEHYTPGLPDVFHDQIGWLHGCVAGLERRLSLRSVQWAYWSGDVRLNEARRLTQYAAPGVAAIIGGDLNALWPDCHRNRPLLPGRTLLHREFEPEWSAMPRHKRLHKTLPPGARPQHWWSRRERLVSDRRATRVLAEAGFVSAGCVVGDMTVTVNPRGGNQGARIDHIVVSPLLAPAVVPGTYQVWTGALGDQASDHRMVSVRLDFERLPSQRARSSHS